MASTLKRKKPSSSVPAASLAAAPAAVAPGLMLPTRTIQRVSGPISMYYLHPPPKKPTFPLVLLFGDRHKGRSEMCSDCSTDPQCMHLHDKAFLTELDTLALSYPVDFFTEYAHTFPDSPNPSDLLFHHFLQKTTAPCHDKVRRSKRAYRTECPTRRVRWHYTDVRFMRTSVKGSTPVIEGNFLEDGRDSIPPEMYLEPIIDILWDTTNYPTPKDVLAQIAVHQPHEFIKKRREGYFQQSSLAEEGYYAHVELYRLLLLSATKKESTNTMCTTVITFALSLFQQYESTRQSLIFKQMEGLPYPLRTLSTWIEILSTTASHNPKLQSNYRALQEIVHRHPPEIMKMMKALLLDLMNQTPPSVTEQQVVEYRTWEEPFAAPVDTFTEMEMNLYDTVSIFRTLLMDSYTAMRMLKPVTDSAGPLLALGYHGNMHTVHLVSILTHPLIGFRMSYAHPMNGSPLLRCLTIQQNIPLVDDMAWYAKTAYQTQRQAKALQLYQERIREEKEARIANTPNGANRNNENMRHLQENEYVNILGYNEDENENENENENEYVDILGQGKEPVLQKFRWRGGTGRKGRKGRMTQKKHRKPRRG